MAIRSLPLQRRVASLSAIAVALAVAITSVAGYLTVRISVHHALDAHLTEVATSLTDPVAHDLRHLGGLTETAEVAGNFRIAAVRSDGAVFHVPDERVHLVIGPEELGVARSQERRPARSAVASDGKEYRMIAVPMTELDGFALVLGRPLAPTHRILNSLGLSLALFGAVGVAAAAIAGAAVARSSLRPLRDLTAAVEHVRATTELTPISVRGNDELSRLAEAFNRMLSSLASSRERQRQLIADAGHELRTPLTSLRTNIELLAADAKTGMLRTSDRAEILADVSAQLAEFTSLIGDLVQLARDDSAAPPPEPLDFRDVVSAALDRVRRRGPSLTFDVELNPCYVLGDADALERAVTNLLDNAVKWSPPGGTIRVQLEGDRLRVADQGPGIADADLPFIFDRFYRADAARNTPGTGLGLSIVEQTIARHGGAVWAGESAQGGAELTVRLPSSTTIEGLGVRASEPHPVRPSDAHVAHP